MSTVRRTVIRGEAGSARLEVVRLPDGRTQLALTHWRDAWHVLLTPEEAARLVAALTPVSP